MQKNERIFALYYGNQSEFGDSKYARLKAPHTKTPKKLSKLLQTRFLKIWKP
jgi:hypothetical protein